MGKGGGAERRDGTGSMIGCFNNSFDIFINVVFRN